MATSTLIESREWVTYRCPTCGRTDRQRAGVQVICLDPNRKHPGNGTRIMRHEARNTRRTR